jgi:hypothetical protein
MLKGRFMDSKILQDEGLRITVDIAGDACWVKMQDLRSGHAWPRVPALAVEVYDRGQQRLDRLVQYRIDQVQAEQNCIHIVVGDRTRGITVGIWMRLNDGALSVLLSPAEVYEYKPTLYRVFAVDVLPGLMRADAKGEMLLPINTGIICRPGDKPKREDRFLIYGEQSRWELLPNLPVCAVQTPTGGLMALAVAGAAETECRVATDGLGGGTVGLSFFLRGHDPDPIEPAARDIRIIPIPPGKDVTVFTAGVLRRHIMGDLGKPTLRQRADESPEVAHLLGAYIMKLFYGVQMQGYAFQEQDLSGTPKFILTMTFDEARAGLKQFLDAGVEKVYTQNVGWNYRGHDGAYPTRFPIEERVGGERAFRELIAFGHSIGYQMTVHDNYLDAYEASKDFDLDLVIVDRYGQPQVRGFWGGGASYILWPPAFRCRHLEDQMMQVKALGIRGPYYLDAMGSPLYVNYHPKHRGSRSDLARGIDRLLLAAKKIFGSVATESGFLYNSITPDLVANPGTDWHLSSCRPEWPVTALLDQRVPLWNLTMSGLVVTENQSLEWTDTMRALLYNQHPRYEWATRPGVQPVLDRVMIRKIKARYDLLIKRFGHLRTQQMTDYHREGKVETTTFEDGTRVTADFAHDELHVNGKRIERPEGA